MLCCKSLVLRVFFIAFAFGGCFSLHLLFEVEFPQFVVVFCCAWCLGVGFWVGMVCVKLGKCGSNSRNFYIANFGENDHRKFR